MRLSTKQLKSIKACFAECFFMGDALWLFGSRTDDLQRGGDIDLYIETTSTDLALVDHTKLKFLKFLQQKLGEQKIDVILNVLSQKKDLPVHTEARKTGILLMKKQPLLASYIRSLDIHARRLRASLSYIEPLLPMTEDKIYNLSDNEASHLNTVNDRFSKMQDSIGSKVFPVVAELANKKARTFIDVLNVMEKLELLDNAAWFEDFKEIRNIITHEYEEDCELVARDTNLLIPKVHELLAYWNDLKPKLAPFLAVAETNNVPSSED